MLLRRYLGLLGLLGNIDFMSSLQVYYDMYCVGNGPRDPAEDMLL